MAAVRKRIVIGLLILSAIGTAVFFVLQPKEGSVEWHKKEFTEAASRMKPGAWSQRLGRTYENVTRREAPWIHDWHEEKEKYLSSYAATGEYGVLGETAIRADQAAWEGNSKGGGESFGR